MAEDIGPVAVIDNQFEPLAAAQFYGNRRSAALRRE